MTQEKTYFTNDKVRITNSRAILGEKTYAMSNITSVSMGTIPANYNPAIFLAVAGISGLILGPQIDASMCMVVGIVLLILGIILAVAAKTQYSVRLGSSSGESDALSSPDQGQIRKIVDAMNDAIIDRG